MDPNFVRIVNPKQPGASLVLHRRDLTPDDVLFDESVHSLAAIQAAEATRTAEKALATKAAEDAAKKSAEPAKGEPPKAAPVLDAKPGKK